jgi:hypothetical protein
MNVRRTLGVITEMLAVLSGVFFADYSGVPLAWSLLSSTRESKQVVREEGLEGDLAARIFFWGTALCEN